MKTASSRETSLFNIFRSPKTIIIFVMLSFALGTVFQMFFVVSTVHFAHRIQIQLPRDIIGQNIILLETKRLARLIEEKNPHISAVSLTKQFPHSIRVDFTIRKPVAQVAYQGQWLLVSDNGAVIALKQKTSTSLTAIYFFQSLRPYERKLYSRINNQDIMYAIGIAAREKNLPFSLEKISVAQPQKIILVPQEYPFTIELTTKKDIDKNIFLVHNIVKSVNINGIKPVVINLEFAKPIISL